MIQIRGTWVFEDSGTSIITEGGEPRLDVELDRSFTAVETSVLAHDTVSQDLYTLASSPINIVSLKQELIGYDPVKASEIWVGFTLGFPLYYSGLHLPSDAKNLKLALEQPGIVKQKIQAEIAADRVASPFANRPIPTLRVSPLGLVPKKEPNKLTHSSFVIPTW